MIEIRNILFNESELSSIARLYKRAWESESIDFLERFKRHATYPGFRGVLASDGEEIISFTYGYTSLEGQYYHELLKNSLSEEQESWLSDCFELVELVVDPSYRRKNVGQVILQELIEHSTNKTAILTTQIDNIPARKLYEKLGWLTLKEDFFPSENAKPYVIMGKKLID